MQLPTSALWFFVTLTSYLPDLVCSQNLYAPPIPLLKNGVGVKYNSPATGEPVQVCVEMFLEVLCVDSAEAWPVLKAVADHYGSKLELIVHQFPLPYHRNSVLCTQGYYLILDQNPGKALDYMQAILDQFWTFGNSVTENKTQSEITGDLAVIAEQVTGFSIKKENFTADIGKYNRYTRYSWKYAARRGVAGTPWFFINGVHIPFDPSRLILLEEWQQVLDPLFVDADTELSGGKWSGDPVISRAARSIPRLQASALGSALGIPLPNMGYMIVIVFFTSWLSKYM